MRDSNKTGGGVLPTFYRNLALVERLGRGWVVLTDDDVCTAAIGPLSENNNANVGAQVGTFSKRDQTARFYTLPVNHDAAERLICAALAYAVTPKSEGGKP